MTYEEIKSKLIGFIKHLLGIETVELKKLMQDDKINTFCSAIKEHEGYYTGSRSFRNKNPGNLRYIQQMGTIGRDANGFAIFQTYQKGWDALVH